MKREPQALVEWSAAAPLQWPVKSFPALHSLPTPGPNAPHGEMPGHRPAEVKVRFDHSTGLQKKAGGDYYRNSARYIERRMALGLLLMGDWSELSEFVSRRGGRSPHRREQGRTMVGWSWASCLVHIEKETIARPANKPGSIHRRVEPPGALVRTTFTSSPMSPRVPRIPKHETWKAQRAWLANVRFLIAGRAQV